MAKYRNLCRCALSRGLLRASNAFQPRMPGATGSISWKHRVERSTYATHEATRCNQQRRDIDQGVIQYDHIDEHRASHDQQSCLNQTDIKWTRACFYFEEEALLETQKPERAHQQLRLESQNCFRTVNVWMHFCLSQGPKQLRGLLCCRGQPRLLPLEEVHARFSPEAHHILNIWREYHILATLSFR